DGGVERDLPRLNAALGDEEGEIAGVEGRYLALDLLRRIAEREVAKAEPSVAQRDVLDQHPPARTAFGRGLCWRGRPCRHEQDEREQDSVTSPREQATRQSHDATRVYRRRVLDERGLSSAMPVR